ncbi:hypothetical protein E3T47_00555 [Cryobacterium ruanii]|uniref:Transposase n=1 Tax=Cryobacterium ruanii TaxID=1259197 RepID=A0A4R9AV30_9MICO|nr:hypothetical protein E3T47_00555 [Cryobacterium ruanii]
MESVPKHLGADAVRDDDVLIRYTCRENYHRRPGLSGVRSAARSASVGPALPARLFGLQRENRELRRANNILRSASAFFAAEHDRTSIK